MAPKFLVGLWTVLRGTWWVLHQLPFLLPAPPTAAGSLAPLLTVRAPWLAFEAAAELAFSWDRGPRWLGRMGQDGGGGAIGSRWRQKQPRARRKGGAPSLPPPQSPRAAPSWVGEGGLLTGSRKTSWRRGEQEPAPPCPWVQGPRSCAAPWRGHRLPGSPPEGGRAHRTARSLGSEKSCFCFPSA